MNADSRPNHENWRSFAACKSEDPELFFPIGDTIGARMQADEAKAVCRRCPAIDWCRQWAFATRQDAGVWGGLSEQDRAGIHRRRVHTEWERPRNVAQHMWENRRDELEQLVGEGLVASQIAARMGTNVQTVNRLLDRLNAAKATEEVKAA